MAVKKRQKLCYHCEGEVDLDVIVCPYCAADLRAERVAEPEPVAESIAAALDEVASIEKPVQPERTSSLFRSTILFTVGIQLALFGLLMLLFSHKGVILLKWDARLWFLYLFAAVPFLVIGYRSLSKL